MKITTVRRTAKFFALVSILNLTSVLSYSQNFQRLYGTSLDNTFSKVIKDGSNYYVLGQDEFTDGTPPSATVTRLDANGIHQWTLSLNISSVWNDAVLTPSGDLLVVGSTLPFDATSKSLMGLVTPAGGGNFTWVRTYDVPGREANTRIVRSPSPQNPAFPYYVTGSQFDSNGSATWDDIFLLNINESGTFNWKKRFPSVADDEFARNLDVMPNGDLILGGNLGTQGVILRIDNSGALINGATPDGIQFSYADVTPISGGGFYAVGGTFPSFTAHLLKYDANLIAIWSVTLSGLTSISQVSEESSSGDIYVIGTGVFNGISRAVLLRLTDLGSSPNLQWVKFPDNSESSYVGGSITIISGNQFAFVDGRASTSAGFGQQDAFMSVNDLDFQTCITVEDFVNVDPVSLTYIAPFVPDIEFFDFSTGTDVLSSALNWQQEEVCSSVPCVADFIFDFVNCGNIVDFTNASSGPAPLSYAWNFGDPSSGANNTSIQQDPTHTFTGGCNGYNVCLTVTGNGCSNMLCKTVQLKYPIAPILTCPPNVVLNCSTNISPAVTGMAVMTEPCDAVAPVITFSDVTLGMLPCNATIVRTWTTTDECGMPHSCAQVINVIDNIAPTIACPNNITISSASCPVVVQNLQPTNVADNCVTPSVSYVITGATSASGQNNASGLMYNQGVSTVTYTASDNCGNTATCSFTVTVNCESSNNQKCGWTVATCYAANAGDPVAVIYDTRFNSQAVPGADWGAGAPPVPGTHPLSWKRDSIGNVFGIALDNNSKIYLGASDIYRYDNPSLFPAYGSGGAAGVYMTDCNPPYPTSVLVGTLNQPILFPITGSALPNTANAGGNGIGNIAFDQLHNQLFLTNLEDGRIYRIDLNGNLLSAYDPFQLDNGQAGLAGILGERIWGIDVYNNRVYFARENLLTNKQIWSIPIDAITGEFIATTAGGNLFTGVAQLEITNGPGSQKKYTDIAFSPTGLMLVAERGNPHDAGIYEFKFTTGWIPSGNNFVVGNNVSGKNSAGGVDYGYREQNGNPTANCGELIWASGNCMDPIAIPNGWCQVYGIEGISSTGNTYPTNSSTDIYIDFDGLYSTNPKYQIGDVEVFKCGCPGAPAICDSISITSTPFNGAQDTCCFKLTVNNQKPNYWTAIQLCTNNGVSISNISLLNSWCLQSFSASQVTLAPPGCIPNEIAVGSQDFIKFCLSNYQNVPSQEVIVKYFGLDYEIVCEDTLLFACTQKPKCMKITSTIECAPNGQYLMDFCIMSNSLIGFNVNSIQLNPPPNVTFTPNIFVVNNLMPGQMQCNFSTLISGAVVDGQSICYSVTAHNGNILSMPPPADPSPCCTDTLMQACVTMPECVCNKLVVETMSVSMPGDECCWKVTLLNNYSNTFFTGVQLNIITPGVVFGAINNSSFLWNLSSTPTQATFTKLPPGTFIGASDMLPTFCLSGITSSAQVPQIVVLKWLDTNGKEVCVDTLKFNCTPPVVRDCAVLVSPQIECDPSTPGFYNFSFQVQNNFGFTINQVVLNNMTPPAISPSQFTLTPPLLNGQTSTQVLSAHVSGVQPGQQVCFYLTVNEIGPNGNELNCCTHSQQYCFTIPTCIDSCCADSTDFAALLSQGFTLVHSDCMVTVTAPQFDSCYWFGTPPYVVGGSPPTQVITDPSGSWTFTFASNGTYQICVTVFDGCQSGQMCTQVSIDCPSTCQCGTFSDMAIRFERGPGVPIICGASPVFLSCPPPGYTYTLSGKFQCQGTGCPPNAPLDAQLTQPDGTQIALGSQSANPYFGIPISNLLLQQSGVYTVTLTGHCGTQTCLCVIKFLLDPPCINLCPCEPEDIEAFHSAVDRSFARVMLPDYGCSILFYPIGLSDCESVEWFLNDTIGTPIGTTVGNQPFAYDLLESGSYTVIMDVTKKKDDGSKCDKQMRSQNVTIPCQHSPDCVDTAIDNPSFSLGAQAGGMNSEGKSRGWNAAAGNPEVIAGEPGSLDGWSIQLSGNLDTADILSRLERICLEPGPAVFATTVKGSKSNSDNRRFPSTLKVFLGRGWAFPPTFKINECDGIDCYELVSIQLPALDSGEWAELQVPYDLSGWDALDSCGGIFVRPLVYVTNPLSNDQGAAETYSYAQLDNFCFNGTIVAVHDLTQKQDVRFYPNPTTGDLTVELSSAAVDDMILRVVSITGQVLMEKRAEVGNAIQTLDVNGLSQGMYFVQITSEGHAMAVRRFVKQ